ncbi:disulfide bond formation protein B [Pseudooceanicola sp.]|uniref:disulfide bond formation protein B n=1 Tax=Pseudooceanicola sp. TaxID=1914328 RepID=UPI002617EC2D|nr:disulfide bond formation protein B [Pseudooceanicola sp.]MDF1855429.1 disulfide bond formation protein B [Pseudooceanicola sp.]
MSFRKLVLLASAGSAALLLGALAFQYLGGFAPCKMCFWQRYPHIAAIGIGALALALNNRALAWLGALAALSTAAIGLYHSGVERKFWAGPSSCTGNGDGIGSLSGSDLLSTDGPVGLVMCDDIAWQMLGVTMANLNMVLSLVLALIWIAAARRG